jgi:uncharacterized protein (DUF305 family)
MKTNHLILAIATAATLAAGCQAGTPVAGGASSSPAASTVQANDADRAFIDGMVPHHEMAVMMADDALAKATKADLKTFAQQVKSAQGAEITQMKDWRLQWFGSSTTPAMDHMGLKTIAADAQYDVNWAKEMVTHHQGAIDMSKQALTAASRPEVKALAQRIIDAQQKEIDQLNAWIKAWSS